MAGNTIEPIMIPAALRPRARAAWQVELQQAWKDPQALLAHLGHAPGTFELHGAPAFPFRVTRGFAGRMRPGDPLDPLLLQVLPLAEEDRRAPGFGPDPVGDRAAGRSTGLLHKYRGRALLIATGACPIHCRYCFRREFDYADHRLDRTALDTAIEYIRTDGEIDEVILSGGDPLMLGTARLRRITDALRTVPQIRRLRLHSRVPIVLPERMDAELAAWIEDLPWRLVVVVHANHPHEFDDSVASGLAQLRQHGADVLNQAVLLAGINDRVETLETLMKRGHEAGALPYYLHLLDPVRGSAHFEVPKDRATALVRALRRRLPGYLVPRLAQEISGRPSKTVIV